MAPSAFHYTHRVAYSECTLGNHVYYARYPDILEAARGEFFRQLGAPLKQLQEQEVIFPVAECHLHYRAPARYDDVLRVEVCVTAAGRARLNFGYRVVNQSGALLLEARTFHVCAGLNEKPRRFPDGFVERLTPYMIAGPERE